MFLSAQFTLPITENMSDFTFNLRPAAPHGLDILSAERGGSSVDVEQLAQHFHHRGGFRERQRRVLAVIEKHPLFSKNPIY